MLVNCTHCNKEFNVWRSKYQKAVERFKGHIYCCKQCYIDHQLPLYEKFYWCPRCKWIPKHSAVTKKRGTKNYYRSSNSVALDKVNVPLNSNPLRHGSNSMLAIKVDVGDIVTKPIKVQEYTLKRDQLYCSRCNELIDMRKNERMIRRSRQKRLKLEVPRIE